MMNVPLREHLDLALNTVQKDSLVASYLTGLANTADETLFSCDISMCQHLYFFVSDAAAFTLRDNVRRANPKMLNTDGTRMYLCVSEEQLDCGFEKIACIVIKQVLQELQARGTNSTYPECTLLLDEWQRLTESIEDLRKTTASFLKTARSKHASVVLCLQNLDAVDKATIYDILSNVHYFYVLSSNNSNSLTSEVVCRMAGDYVEKEKSITEGKGTSASVSFREKPVLKPDDLNNLGEDAVLIITNHGYVRVKKQGYYCTEPYKSKYEKILAVNREVMIDV
jgi:type IV secretory pathway TraG/TraD family ATPase VirD4